MTGSVYVYSAGPGRWHVEDCGPFADSYGLAVYPTKEEAVREGRHLAGVCGYEFTVAGGEPFAPSRIATHGFTVDENAVLDGIAIAERRLGLDATQAALDADRDTAVLLFWRLTHDEGSARAAEGGLRTLAAVGGAT